MSSCELSILQALKISLLCRGISVSKDAELALTGGGATPMSVHEYPTTGGLSLVLNEDIYVNAPFDEPIAENPEAVLLFDKNEDAPFRVLFHREEFRVKVLPLPGYLSTRDSNGRLATESVFSHGDRARLSPIGGCHNRCLFCDSPLRTYELRHAEQLLEALSIAVADTALPAHHAVISGGTPRVSDYGYFGEVCQSILSNARIPVDVMMSAQLGTDLIDQLCSWGAYGFAINMELYDNDIAKRIAPEKRGSGLKEFCASIERSVQNTGGSGRVRSLLLVGLEPEDQTLKGVELLAELGCDPVLSPFRPASGTLLAGHPGPSYELLERVYLRSLDIVERHGVKLGPRCIPCTHNALTLADVSGEYYFSWEL